MKKTITQREGNGAQWYLWTLLLVNQLGASVMLDDFSSSPHGITSNGNLIDCAEESRANSGGGQRVIRASRTSRAGRCMSVFSNQGGIAGDLAAFTDDFGSMTVSGYGLSHVLTATDTSVAFNSNVFYGSGALTLYLNTPSGYVGADPVVLALGATQMTIPLRAFAFSGGGATGKTITGYMIYLSLSQAYVAIDDIAIVGAAVGALNTPGETFAPSSETSTPETSTGPLVLGALLMLAGRRIRRSVRREATPCSQQPC